MDGHECEIKGAQSTTVESDMQAVVEWAKLGIELLLMQWVAIYIELIWATKRKNTK